MEGVGGKRQRWCGKSDSAHRRNISRSCAGDHLRKSRPRRTRDAAPRCLRALSDFAYRIVSQYPHRFGTRRASCFKRRGISRSAHAVRAEAGCGAGSRPRNRHRGSAVHRAQCTQWLRSHGTSSHRRFHRRARPARPRDRSGYGICCRRKTRDTAGDCAARRRTGTGHCRWNPRRVEEPE